MISHFPLDSIRSAVFAGGGNRCLWQAGFWEIFQSEINCQIQEFAAVSAGATVSCLINAGTFHKALALFQEATDKNESNMYPGNIFSGDPVFPHYKIYRGVLEKCFDVESLKKLQSGPDIRILIARPPLYLHPSFATFAGIGLYTLEKMLFQPVHPGFAKQAGFKASVVSVRSLQSPAELVDLLLCSSCTPPMTPLMLWEDSIALDGGVIDNVPVSALTGEHWPAIILLTRLYEKTTFPDAEKRLYIQPSKELGISKWDYTNPEGLQKAYELGKKDCMVYLSKISDQIGSFRT